MAVKVVFIGNAIGGDDGIGPALYKELKDNPSLKRYELLELGVIGFDLINYIDENDKLIIVDAIHDEDVGKVRVLSENDLSKDLNVVSQHDFGIEQTATIIRTYMPGIQEMKLIGINVKEIKAFTPELSLEIKEKFEDIKREVLEKIIEIGG